MSKLNISLFYFFTFGCFLFILELAALGILSFNQDQFESRENQISLLQSQFLVKNLLRYKSHPYFGLVYSEKINEVKNKEYNFRVNNHGFLAQDDYPYSKKDSEELTIGIFGGSVALGLSLYLYNNPSALVAFEREIGRKIKILNF